ncbi:MAG TPA: glycoside hydrolase family 5 protein [Thermoguttaceae bacterium]|nr:glycoside hydrolase family 5 protein [Thermoguttaceae bacterium]
MKRLALLLLLLAIPANHAFAEVGTPSFVQTHGQLSVRGTQLVDAAGQPVVLRGMSFGWHVWWPQFWNGEAVKWLQDDWHCTVLRAAMGIEPGGGYLQSPEASKKLVTTVVDACIENGMYVIIDWHDHHATANLQQSKAFFVEMAKRYGKHPNIIYEIYNEPERDSWPAVKAYSETLIQAIREVDPDNIILVGSSHWDQDVHLAADDPITGATNIMYTLHFYAGTHKQSLRDRGDYALKKGLPLFVSEYGGCEASGNGPLNMQEWNAWIAWMEARKISWCKWSIADKNETCSVLIPHASPTGNWPLTDLKPSGIHTRELLRELNR